MRNTSMSRFVTGLLILLAVVFVKADLGAEAENEKLVTSGVKLKPVLIGTQITDKDRKLADEGNKFGEPLNIVIDTPYQIWGEMGTYIHLAIYDPKFNAAAEAVVYMDGQAIGKADKTGTFVFSVAPNPDQSYGNSHALDVVYTKPGGKKHRGTVSFNSYPRTQGFESTSIFVYTDRGVYNPGQTIRIRSIAWSLKDDFFPLEDKKLEFLLKNDRGQVVAGGGVETDTWGISHMEIPLPDNAPEGKYTLEANHERESASADLRIERFTPPVIEIRHTLGRFLTRDAKELPFDVTLGYFGGGSFKAGKIKITVKAAGRIEYEDEKEVKGKGPHAFMFDKKALKKIRKNMAENEYVQVKIAVEDEYERKDEVKRDMRYTSNPYTVIVEMDKDQYTTGETAHVMVRATDLDMVPIREKEVKLVLEGKKYNEKTDKGGIAKFDIEVPERYLSGEVFLEGVDNPVAYAAINWIAPRPMSSEIPQGYVKEKQDTDIVIRFPTDFIPGEDVVHVDIVDSSGALIGAALVPVKRRRASGWQKARSRRRPGAACCSRFSAWAPAARTPWAC
ncbi:MAG: MG2 domain-containing protein [Pseudomonadota bacterium]